MFIVSLAVVLALSLFHRSIQIIADGLRADQEGAVSQSHGVISKKGVIFVLLDEIDHKVGVDVWSKNVIFFILGGKLAVLPDGGFPVAWRVVAMVFEPIGPEAVFIKAQIGGMVGKFFKMGELPFSRGQCAAAARLR